MQYIFSKKVPRLNILLHRDETCGNTCLDNLISIQQLTEKYFNVKIDTWAIQEISESDWVMKSSYWNLSFFEKNPKQNNNTSPWNLQNPFNVTVG